MKCRILGTLLLACGLTSTCAQAADTFDMEKLKQLFNTYQRQQAYDYASRYLGEMEGDGNFDYLYGVAAIDAGHASQGVFALERVLIQFPNDQVARLELARGYFILEEYARARQEFEKVLAANPPRGVRDTTETFLEKIRISEARYRTTMGGNVTLGLGSDSNVNSGPDDSGLTLIQLEDSSLGHSDTYTELTASWGVGYPLAPGWMLTGNITGAFLQNQEFSEFDTTTGTVLAGVSRVYKQSRYKGELMYQQFQLDGEEYRSLNGLNLGWQYNFSQKSSLDSTVQYATLEFPTVTVKNATLTSLAFTYTHNLDGALQPLVFATLNIGSEAADDSSNASALSDTERDILGLRLGTILAFSSKLALQMAAGMQTSDYAGGQTFPSPQIYGLMRQDDYTTANLNLIWLINRDWRLDTKLGYSKNDSNVELYTYDRTTFGLEANYAF
jgi:tetratricopeptide (TPR) repeat protein